MVTAGVSPLESTTEFVAMVTVGHTTLLQLVSVTSATTGLHIVDRYSGIAPSCVSKVTMSK